MAKYRTDQIRNIALCGHGGTGKTTLADAMLFKAGVINRIGKVTEGNTVSDYTPEEKDAGYSMHLGIMNAGYKDKQFNILDCPGYPDFIAGAYQGINVTDTAVVCIAASAGIQVTTRKMWELSEGKARVIAVTRMDAPQASFSKIVEQVREIFGMACAPIAWPVGGDGGDGFTGCINLLTASELEGDAEQAKQNLIENAVSSNEDMLMMYLEGEPIPEEDLNKTVLNAVISGDLIPIIPVAAEKDAAGVDVLMDVLADICPAPNARTHTMVSEEGDDVVEEEIAVDENGPFLAQVFRVKADPHLRRLTFFSVRSGTLDAGATVKVVGAAKGERVQQLLRFQGGKHEEVARAIPGDILATAKVDTFNMNDTLCTGNETRRFKSFPFPIPMVRLAIEPKSRNDAAKCSEKLRELENEDPTFLGRYDPITKELVISGLGQLHLDAKLNALRKQSVDVNTRPPKIPYQETIAGSADVRYRHKKQSGGAGQFGEVAIRIRPAERGEGFIFENKIVGGVIPGPFIPSVEKGIRNKLNDGIIAGYPVVDLVVELYDGKSHPVDSKDIAFQIAGREAIKRAVREAKPIILEPIVKLEVTIPQQQMGDITGMISGKRGQPSGMDSLGDMVVVKAEVPLAEIQNFSSEIKSITGGAGSYMIEMSHYSPVPGNVQQDIIKHAELKEDVD